MSDVEFPEKLKFLFQPSRYKVLYGGRGGAKSWGVARSLLLRGVQQPMRILCAREFQSSIQDSVHRLLSDQIDAMGLHGFYEIQKASIRGANGTEFGFEGIRHNVSKIKSYEGADICWVEEADQVSKASWNVLIPTIRKEGSEIIVTFNPQLETDETYQRFVIHPPESAQVAKVNYNDNPWFPEVLRLEMEAMKAADPDSYLNIWEGHCRQALEGAVYAKELQLAVQENRITRVPYDKSKPVHTFWDLGRSDSTSIWFAQIVGFDFRVIDFYESSQYSIAHYLEVLQNRRYVYGTDHLPHDAANETIQHPLSIEGQLKAAGRKVKIIPRIGIEDGINAARTIFPRCWFDQEKCADGIQALRHYRYELNDKTGILKKEPHHDWASHAADAFRYLALGLKDPKPKVIQERKSKLYELGNRNQSLGWMGN